MCGPRRGRFRAVNLSASGSYVFVVGRHGELYTRLYDFDISGHDPVFFSYSYEDQRGKGDGAPIQLPAAPWVRQPRIPGAITVSDLDPQDGHGRPAPHPARRGTARAAPPATGSATPATAAPLGVPRHRPAAARRAGCTRGAHPRSPGRRELTYAGGRRAPHALPGLLLAGARDRRRQALHLPPRRRPAPAGARPRARRRAARAVRRAIDAAGHVEHVTLEATRDTCSSPSAAGRCSEDPAADRHAGVGPQQDHAALLVGRAEAQHLGHERPDLARREVDHRDDEPPLELLTRVVGDLRRRALGAELGPEVDGQLPGGLARLGEVVDRRPPGRRACRRPGSRRS